MCSYLLSSFLCSDSYIVRVKAVVMTRDDSSGGWLNQDGGALSRVGVCRLLPTELAPVLGSTSSQFFIRGERMRDNQVKYTHAYMNVSNNVSVKDQKWIHVVNGWCVSYQQVILDCPLRKDLVYTIATPTFHHWKVEDRRCGLSFQSPADARAFDRGVRKAIDDLAEGKLCCNITIQMFWQDRERPVLAPIKLPELKYAQSLIKHTQTEAEKLYCQSTSVNSLLLG